MSSLDLGTERVEASEVGRYNMVEMFNLDGTFVWNKPADIDPDSDVLVHVWGAGGSGGTHGGGGGGLAVKRVKVTDLLSTTVISVGQGNRAANVVGGTSSFGTHCSATGGNGGSQNADNEGLTGFGAGGMGIGGDINRRGGRGGQTLASATYGRGGGGSAPAPYGRAAGYRGGDADGPTYNSSGGGGGIGGEGGDAALMPIGIGTGGGGSMTRPTTAYQYGDKLSGSNGGNGLLGPGGLGAHYNSAGTSSTPYNMQRNAESGKGAAVVKPNLIIFGGGGGGGSIGWNNGGMLLSGGQGGPGAGGGGVAYNTTPAVGPGAGNGGMLGGGGGGYGTTQAAGDGGNAGGGGGTGMALINGGYGGAGLVIIQYRLII